MGRRGSKNTQIIYDRANTGAMAQGYQSRQHYSLNEKLDLSESRSIEFKAGAGFIHHGFHENVGKYVCGFVNSYQDGMLMIGVENGGLIQGYSVNRHEEDSLRCQVDQAIKEISPDVFPRDYTLRFVPVLNQHGNHSGDRYVIELSVQGSNFAGADRLYECKAGVFLRRDGSLEGPLKPKKIQEWNRRNHESEMEKMRKNERNLQKEMDNLRSQATGKGRELERKGRELELKEKDLSKKEAEYKLMKEEMQKKSLELEQQKTAMKHLEETHEQQQQQQQDKSQTNDETMKELGEIKKLLSKQQKSKVCAIM